MYITPSSRKQGKATWLAKVVEDIAKQRGCIALITTINTDGKINVTRSMAAILSYGFQYMSHGDGFLSFKKDLK